MLAELAAGEGYMNMAWRPRAAEAKAAPKFPSRRKDAP